MLADWAPGIDGRGLSECALESVPARTGLEWRPPREARKASVIPVRRNPFTTGFDGQCREPGILRQIAACIALRAQIFKDRPVSGAWCGNGGVRLLEEDPAEIEDVHAGTGLAINS